MILDDVIGFCESHKLIVALELKSSRDLSHHLEATVECVDDESLLNFKADYRGHNVYGIYERLNSFDLSCESQYIEGLFLSILPQLLFS